MKIKKAFVDIIAYLEANSNKAVKTVLPELKKMCQVQRGKDKAVYAVMDKEGNILGLYCKYFEKWFPIVGTDTIKFAVKKGNTTGYSYMCQLGMSKNQRAEAIYREEHQKILDGLAAMTYDAKNYPTDIAELETIRDQKASIDLGFAEKDDLIDFLLEQDYDVDVSAE